jgi:phage gp37-like protein
VSTGTQSNFPQDQAWRVLNAMLAQQLAGVDVQPVSEKDYNGDELILTPPSVRTYFGGSVFAATSDSQKLSYDVTSRFFALCADENRGPDAIEQAYASAHLAVKVSTILAGARINLPSGDQSEPITLVAIEPLPAAGIGMGYAVAVEVPGLAQYTGANAAGYTAQGGQR